MSRSAVISAIISSASCRAVSRGRTVSRARATARNPGLVQREPRQIDGTQRNDADRRKDDQPEEKRGLSPIDLVSSPDGYDPSHKGADNPRDRERYRPHHQQYGKEMAQVVITKRVTASPPLPRSCRGLLPRPGEKNKE
jgi:hypothetical protein